MLFPELGKYEASPRVKPAGAYTVARVAGYYPLFAIVNILFGGLRSSVASKAGMMRVCERGRSVWRQPVPVLHLHASPCCSLAPAQFAYRHDFVVCRRHVCIC